MPHPDPCIRETPQEQVMRLEGDLLSWAQVQKLDPLRLLSIIGALSCHLIADMEARAKQDFLEDFISTLRTGVAISRRHQL